MKTKSIVVLVCMLSLVLSGCAPLVHPPTALPSLEVAVYLWGPPSGLVYSLSDTINLEALIRFGYVPASTLSSVAFLANGSLIEEGTPMDPATGSSVSTWTPGIAGEYYIQARATLTDSSFVISEPHRICVMPFAAPPQWRVFGGYTSVCQLPTQVPISNRATTGDVVIHAVVAPAAVQFANNGLCHIPNPSVTFIATVDDPQDLVALVSELLVNAGGSAQDGEYLNWITSRPSNQKEYRRTVQLTSAFGAGTSHWYLSAHGRDGLQLGSAQGVINSEFVGCNPLVIGPSATLPVIEILPSETATQALVGPPTFTLRKNAFCRKGPDTSFSDVDAILAGETVDILNKSEDGFWYFVSWKRLNAKCWVAASAGAVAGDMTGIKVLIGPALPKSVPGPKPPPAPGSEPAPVPCNPLIKACP